MSIRVACDLCGAPLSAGNRIIGFDGAVSVRASGWSAEDRESIGREWHYCSGRHNGVSCFDRAAAALEVVSLNAIPVQDERTGVKVKRRARNLAAAPREHGRSPWLTAQAPDGLCRSGLDLGIDVTAALVRANVLTVDALERCRSDGSLASLPGIGPKRRAVIVRALDAAGRNPHGA